MMKKIGTIVIAAAMISCFILPVTADTEETIITMDLDDTASFTVGKTGELTNKNWSFTGSSGGTNTSEEYTIQNDGSIAINVTVVGTNSSDWSLNDTADHNNFTVAHNLSGSFTNILTSEADFITNFADDASDTFHFEVELPTTVSTVAQQQTTITFEATAC